MAFARRQARYASFTRASVGCRRYITSKNCALEARRSYWVAVPLSFQPNRRHAPSGPSRSGSCRARLRRCTTEPAGRSPPRIANEHRWDVLPGGASVKPGDGPRRPPLASRDAAPWNPDVPPMDGRSRIRLHYVSPAELRRNPASRVRMPR